MGLQGIISEYVDNSQILPSGRLRVQIDDVIDYLNVDKTMLLRFISKIKKKAVGRMEHQWQTQERKADTVSLSAQTGWNGASTTGTFTLTNSTDAWLFAETDIVMIPSESFQQAYYVTSVNQGTGVISAITVDGTATPTISTGTKDILLVSNSFEQGTGRGVIKSEQPTLVSNFIQIVQTPMGMTTTAKHLNYRGVSEWDKQKFEIGVDHAFKMEKNFFFGEKARVAQGHTDGSSAIGLNKYEQMFMGGMTDSAIGANTVSDGGGAGYTEAEFGAWAITATRWAKRPVVFSGSTIFEGLTEWAQSYLQMTRNDQTLGMAIGKYLTPYGDLLPIAPHRELLTGTTLGGMAFSIDLADIEYRFLQGLDTHIEVGIEETGTKQHIDEIRSWMSMKIGQRKKHAILHNVTSVA